VLVRARDLLFCSLARRHHSDRCHPGMLIGTFSIMTAFGFSLNNLTLFGLVLAIGIVVDDAIVVVEKLVPGRRSPGRNSAGLLHRPGDRRMEQILAANLPSGFGFRVDRDRAARRRRQAIQQRSHSVLRWCSCFYCLPLNTRALLLPLAVILIVPMCCSPHQRRFCLRGMDKQQS